MTDHNSHRTSNNTTQTKVLHAEIPEATYWHIRKCAIESQLSMKDFVAELGRTASPFQLKILDSELRVKDEPNEPRQNSRRAA